MESFNLKDPTITSLTATNEAHSNDFFGKKDIHGGYFARTFVVSEHRRNRANSLLAPLRNPPQYVELIEYLKEISALTGGFRALATREPDDIHTTPYQNPVSGEIDYFCEAGIIYERWYAGFVEEIAEIQDDTGTLNRFGDSVLKVAMLLSLSRSPELYIDSASMIQAISYCERLVGNVRQMTQGKRGLSEASSLKSLILTELLTRDNHQISRAMLLKKMWAHYKEAEELDEIMMSFDQAGMIKTESIGNQIIYVMAEVQLNEMKRRYEGKNR
jgi:hypothetical protein